MCQNSLWHYPMVYKVNGRHIHFLVFEKKVEKLVPEHGSCIFHFVVQVPQMSHSKNGAEILAWRP